jgi:hypothetical protein
MSVTFLKWLQIGQLTCYKLKGDTDASFFGEWQKLYKNSKHRSNENKAEPAKQNEYFSAEQLGEV